MRLNAIASLNHWMIIAQTAYSIVHIATHGKFFPTLDRESFLLLGDSKEYPISNMEILGNLRNVHLVVLSACETALGSTSNDGIEIAGISSYFTGEEGKAKAVIASLWKVDDASTSLLMQEFYWSPFILIGNSQ